MQLGFQLSAVWVGIQLVVLVSATTKSTCNVVRFEQSKSENGDVLCATSPAPTAAANKKTKSECSWDCAHNGATCAAGFNYKDPEARCELFASQPTTLQVQQGCEYYTVAGIDIAVIEKTSQLDYADINLARNKPASQMSTWDDWVAGYAVDGRHDTTSCTTISYANPWLAVDLGAAYDVGHVTVTNYDHNTYASHMDNFVVGLMNDVPATMTAVNLFSYTMCGQFVGSLGPAENATVVCSPSYQKFRYVFIQVTQTGGKYLCLIELYVYARISLDYTDINLALNKPAIQTSTYDGQEASRAVDGLVGVGAASCTLAHSHSSWAVDLGAAYDVGHVTVTNDANAIHAFRLDNFVVGLTNDDPATTPPVYKSSYTMCGQYSGSVAASDNATVFCSTLFQKFRYVIVQVSLTWSEALCLNEVFVFARNTTRKPVLIQQNVGDGSYFFDRSWNEFRVGFGHPSGNFWLGNEHIHQLTKDGGCKLRVDVQCDSSSFWYWAEYNTFIVANETKKYQLTVAGFSGNVGFDGVGPLNGYNFTTFDRDVDNWAVTYFGGFWYGNCGDCGKARVNGGGTMFDWDQLPGGGDLKYSRMWLECL